MWAGDSLRTVRRLLASPGPDELVKYLEGSPIHVRVVEGVMVEVVERLCAWLAAARPGLPRLLRPDGPLLTALLARPHPSLAVPAASLPPSLVAARAARPAATLPMSALDYLLGKVAEYGVRSVASVLEAEEDSPLVRTYLDVLRPLLAPPTGPALLPMLTHYWIMPLLAPAPPDPDPALALLAATLRLPPPPGPALAALARPLARVLAAPDLPLAALPALSAALLPPALGPDPRPALALLWAQVMWPVYARALPAVLHAACSPALADALPDIHALLSRLLPARNLLRALRSLAFPPSPLPLPAEAVHRLSAEEGLPPEGPFAPQALADAAYLSALAAALKDSPLLSGRAARAKVGDLPRVLSALFGVEVPQHVRMQARAAVVREEGLVVERGPVREEAVAEEAEGGRLSAEARAAIMRGRVRCSQERVPILPTKHRRRKKSRGVRPGWVVVGVMCAVAVGVVCMLVALLLSR